MNRPRREPGEADAAYRTRLSIWATQQIDLRRQASKPAAVIVIDGVTYAVTAADGPKLAAAFLRAINRLDTAVALACGLTLTVTPGNAGDVANQLAGES